MTRIESVIHPCSSVAHGLHLIRNLGFDELG
jgi:hypothetical protein